MTTRGAITNGSRDGRETVAEPVKVNDRRRVRVESDLARESRVQRMEEEALRSGSILPV